MILVSITFFQPFTAFRLTTANVNKVVGKVPSHSRDSMEEDTTALIVRAPTLPALLDYCAEEYADEIFLLSHDQTFKEHSVSFRQFHRGVVLAALRLREAGVCKGSRCAFMFDTSNERAITFIMAVISLGAVAVLVNRQIPAHILDNMFKSCRVSFLYLERGGATDFQLARENDIKLIDTTQALQWDESTACCSISSLEDVQTSDPAVIMFTSGTTSVPKGVLHNHSTLLHAVESKRLTNQSIFVPHGTVLGILPLHHVMGFTNTLLYCLYTGFCYAIFDSPVTPELYATAVKRVKPFTFETVPWVLEELATMCKRDPDLLTQMQNLKLVTFGGGKISPQIANFYEVNNIPLSVIWGQTELAATAFCGVLTPGAPERWRLMRPMCGVTAVLKPIEGEEGGELVITNSKTLAIGYIVDGQLLPFNREAYHTNDILAFFYFFIFIFLTCC